MEKTPPPESNQSWMKALKLILQVIVPLAFLATGLILLFLAIPGWSLIIGIPSTVFGIIFLIYTYDMLCCRGDRNIEE
jgi:hypothetical protein